MFSEGFSCKQGRYIGVLALTLVLGAAAVQAASVPYVPTNPATVDAMLRLANVRAEDYLIDLGSGDGRILITAAARYGARGFGVDIDPQRVRESLRNARRAGVADRVHFEQRDLFDTDISRATVVTMYLLQEVNLKLRPRLLAELKPGTRIVSHDFDLGDWKPDITASVRGFGSSVHFWVVPARVAGRWRVEVGGPQSGFAFDAELVQRFQEVEGFAQRDARRVYLRELLLAGDRIRFVLSDDLDYLHREIFEGRVDGDVIEGTMHGEMNAPPAVRRWRAVRVGGER